MKTNLLGKLLELYPAVASLHEQPVADREGNVIGWNHYFMDAGNRALAGGTAVDKEMAKRIAVAECFERALFLKLIAEPSSRKELLLDESPGTSGFAAGFEERGTAYRSACEAVERWAWSQWIDHGHRLPSMTPPTLKDSLARHHAGLFDSVSYFQLELPAPAVPGLPAKLMFSVALGFEGKGVFAGSRVTTSADDPWGHALIEASRNLSNQKLPRDVLDDSANVIGRRARYFGDHAAEAVAQIDRAKKADWPAPKFRIHAKVTTGVDGVFLFRSLCDDFVPWHLGDETRFVY